MSKRKLTILLYQQLTNAINNSGDSEVAVMYNILSTLEGKPVEHYKKMNWTEFKKLYASTEVPDLNLPDTWVSDFEVNGEKFYVTQFATDWNVEQFINMTTLTKDKEQIINNLHLILTTLCYKEKGEIIDKTEFNRRAELFLEHCDARVAYPIGFFFALLLAKLSQTTQYSSIMKKRIKFMKALKKANEKKKLMIQETGSTKNGIGMRLLRKYLPKGIMKKWTTISD